MSDQFSPDDVWMDRGAFAEGGESTVGARLHPGHIHFNSSKYTFPVLALYKDRGGYESK